MPLCHPNYHESINWILSTYENILNSYFNNLATSRAFADFTAKSYIAIYTAI